MKPTRHAVAGRPWLLILLAPWLMLGLLSCAPAPKPRTMPLVHSAYVWKQGWNTQSIRDLSAAKLPSRLTALNVLVGECGLSSGLRAVRPPWPELLAHGRPISLSVRIGTRKAIRPGDAVDLSEGFDLLLSGLADARSAGIPVTSIQVDFDCPERLLASYAKDVRAFKAKLDGLPLTITALPAWLDADGFPELIAAADGWTLQLHGTSRPRLGAPQALFSLADALTWTSRAKRHGRPFRIALPTYAYLACFGKRGEYLGMHAEQSRFPAGTFRTLPLPADPDQIQAYLRHLEDARFDLVSGVDWFRLPFPDDRQNWTMHGLGEVLAGRTLPSRLELVTEQKGGLHDLSVRNPGDQPIAIPSIRIEWSQGQVVGIDATYAWRTEVGRRSANYVHREFVELLGPGERRVVGWLRVSEAQPISSQLLK